MDELIYQFLLQAGFPRASIVVDAELLSPADGVASPDGVTAFAIVDPETADRLAVIDVVGAIDGDELRERARRVGSYARRIGGQVTRSFVIRVDARGQSDGEQVQFYRVRPDSRLQRLTAKTFPDLDGLRVAYLLSVERSIPPIPDAGRGGDDHADVPKTGRTRKETGRTGTGHVVASLVPAILLILLFVVDWFLTQSRGTSLLTVVQTLLVIGAACLLTVIALYRRPG